MALLHGLLWRLDRASARRLLWGDETTYLDSATRLLAGDPGWWPEPLWPPLYAQFVAGITWLGGGSWSAVRLAQSLLLVVVAVMLGDLARRWSGSRAAAFVTAVLTLGYPPLVAFAHYLWPEVLHLFLFVALLWLLVCRWSDPRWCAVAGVVLGLALLTKSLLLPIAPILLLAAARGTRWRAAVPRVALVVAGAALATAPWVVASAHRTGSPMIANSALFNLWVGLNDVGRESFTHDIVWPEYLTWRSSAPTHRERQLVLRKKILAFLDQRGLGPILGEQLSRQYFRLFDASCYLTDQLPGGAARVRAGTGYREVGRRLGAALRLATVTSIVLLLVLAPAGLVLGGCRGQPWVRVLVLFVAYNLALFLWLHVKTRYRIQMLPTAFIGVGCLAAWLGSDGQPRPTWRRLAAASALVVVLLTLALA